MDVWKFGRVEVSFFHTSTLLHTSIAPLIHTYSTPFMPKSAHRAAVTAVGHFLPDERLTNHDLEQMVDTNDEWIRSHTGIRERRHLGEDKPTTYMAVRAAREALARRGPGPKAVDLIIVATITPDRVFPATACVVQDELGAANAWGFDLGAACSGFLYALTTGAQFIETGQCETVLVIGAEKMSATTDSTDRTPCILSGDGAGAVLLEPNTDGYGLVDTVHYTDGSGVESLCMAAGGSLHPPTHATVDRRMHFVRQDGRTVFKRAVEGMADVAAEVMERNDLTAEDVRYLVPHQANRRIIEATAQRMGLAMDQVMVNIDRYGNTTAATVPLCLYDWQEELRAGDKLILSTFGAGFTWGAAYLTWA